MAIAALATIGMARRFVEQRGFECSLQINAEFLAREPVRDFVHCIRMSQTMQWEVALFVRDGTLNNVATKSRAIIKGTQ